MWNSCNNQPFGYTSTFITTCLRLPTRIPPTTRIYIFKEHELCESTECVLNLQARNASSRAHRAHSWGLYTPTSLSAIAQIRFAFSWMLTVVCCCISFIVVYCLYIVNSLSPDPSPKGRGVITLRGRNLTTKAIHSHLFWRGGGGEALYII